jgi:hypothetical protein
LHQISPKRGKTAYLVENNSNSCSIKKFDLQSGAIFAGNLNLIHSFESLAFGALRPSSLKTVKIFRFDVRVVHF